MSFDNRSEGKLQQTSQLDVEFGRVIAKPFVKWPGGKRKLVPEILRSAPKKIKLYWEPFVGGGAVYFEIAQRAERAILSDSNKLLMAAYSAVKYEVEELIQILKTHAREHHKDSGYYYQVREQIPRKQTTRAARFIYLNKTGFNGLYRVNRKGKFNVPKGDYVNPKICDEENLRAVNSCLQKTILFPPEKFEITVQPSAGDLVYCDPPYHKTFTNYQAGGFGENDQIQLRDAAKKWIQLGANVILSNNDTPFIRKLYSEEGVFSIRKILSRRPINRNGKGRGAVPEIIISSKV